MVRFKDQMGRLEKSMNKDMDVDMGRRHEHGSQPWGVPGRELQECEDGIGRDRMGSLDTNTQHNKTKDKMGCKRVVVNVAKASRSGARGIMREVVHRVQDREVLYSYCM